MLAGSQTLFDEAVILVGVASGVKWGVIRDEIERRDTAAPLLHPAETYRRVLDVARTKLDG